MTHAAQVDSRGSLTLPQFLQACHDPGTGIGAMVPQNLPEPLLNGVCFTVAGAVIGLTTISAASGSVIPIP